jgi:hypothetical protein
MHSIIIWPKISFKPCKNPFPPKWQHFLHLDLSCLCSCTWGKNFKWNRYQRVTSHNATYYIHGKLFQVLCAIKPDKTPIIYVVIENCPVNEANKDLNTYGFCLMYHKLSSATFASSRYLYFGSMGTPRGRESNERCSWVKVTPKVATSTAPRTVPMKTRN